MSDPEDLRRRLESSDLPTAIKRHLVACISKGRTHRWHFALEDGFDRVVESTKTVIDTACRFTGRDPDSLIRDTDFDPNDLDPDRLDAAIAELRGINHLCENEGFDGIKLLHAQPGTRTADLVATRKGDRYALDVACSSAGVGRDVAALSSYMLRVARLKDEQLKNTKASDSCRYTGLVFVVNSSPALIWGYQPLYRRAAVDVYDALSRPADFYIVVVTGRHAHVWRGGEYFKGPDDVVYPPWSGGSAS